MPPWTQKCCPADFGSGKIFEWNNLFAWQGQVLGWTENVWITRWQSSILSGLRINQWAFSGKHKPMDFLRKAVAFFSSSMADVALGSVLTIAQAVKSCFVQGHIWSIERRINVEPIRRNNQNQQNQQRPANPPVRLAFRQTPKQQSNKERGRTLQKKPQICLKIQ